jgi:hypothetical protein
MTKPSPSDEAVAAVAKALCKACGRDPDALLNEVPEWVYRQIEARAAIAAHTRHLKGDAGELVERLREAVYDSYEHCLVGVREEDCYKAAALITLLQEEVERRGEVLTVARRYIAERAERNRDWSIAATTSTMLAAIDAALKRESGE